MLAEDHRVNIEGMTDYKPVFVAQNADDSDEEGRAFINFRSTRANLRC